MIKYYKLFDLMNRRGMKKTELLDIMSSPTLAKLTKGEIVKTDIIDRICLKLECQPEDIMEVFEIIEYTDEKGRKHRFEKEIPSERIKKQQIRELEDIEEMESYRKIRKEMTDDIDPAE